jgi:hypothetical protein
VLLRETNLGNAFLLAERLRQQISCGAIEARIPDELLSQVAPLPWAHIALTGDYLWNEIDRPLERFSSIRANRFNPNNFKFP